MHWFPLGCNLLRHAYAGRQESKVTDKNETLFFPSSFPLSHLFRTYHSLSAREIAPILLALAASRRIYPFPCCTR